MIAETPETVIERVSARFGEVLLANPPGATTAATGFSSRRVVASDTSLFDFALPAAQEAAAGAIDSIKGVVAATFSSEERFPPLAVRIASALGLEPGAAALDLQMACSAYPYALYLATRLAADLHGKILVVDADIQSRLLAPNDPATVPVMDDAATATLVSAGSGPASRYSFLSDYSRALSCPASGPISMDGFKVFSFVATEVAAFLRPFGSDFDYFVPHRANIYMVKRLAKTLKLEDKLLLASGDWANPGSASIAATLATCPRSGRALLAGFGAGFSASAAIVTLSTTSCVAELKS